MSQESSQTPKQYTGRETDLTQELIAYYQATACNVDPALLENLLDDLCESDTSSIHQSQLEAKERQLQFVKNLIREREHVEALCEVYTEAMAEACAVGGDYYRDAATQLTELEAEAQDALENQLYPEFTNTLAKMKRLSDQAANRQGKTS